ncbi:MAG: DUF1698 domain-containing protein [Chloroflexota bacterium]
MDETEIRRRIEAVPFWYHSIRLGGIVTPGRENAQFRFLTPDFQEWITQAIPEDLSGQSVLDVGAWDGYFSFLACRRGARRVLAIDKLALRHHQSDASGFLTARAILGADVDFAQLDVLDLDRLAEEFDVIFLFGVLYHLRHPLLALEKLYQKTRSLLLIETHISRDEQPTMRFYEGDEYGGDPTNWWGPSAASVAAMCRACGFSHVELVERLDSAENTESRALFRIYK